MLLVILLSVSSSAQDKTPVINVIYPKDGQTLTSSDSAFIFGSVTPKSSLKINGQDIKVYANGAFLAFLPIQPGEFVFELEATNRLGIALDSVKVIVPTTSTAIPEDSLAIEKGSMLPDVDMNLRAGDIIQVRFKGTPGGKGTFSIEGLVSNLSMVESVSDEEKYWGEEIFGKGDSSSCIQSRGVYTGTYQIKPEDKIENARVTFCLTKELNDSLKFDSSARIDKINNSANLISWAPGRITISQDSIPQVVEFIDSIQIVRAGPGLGYLLLFQPRGIRAIADGQIGEWTRLRLAPDQEGWVKKSSIEFLPSGTPVPRSKVSLIKTLSQQDKVSIIVPLTQKLPFKVEQDSSGLSLSIFGATANTDWIKYDAKDNLIKQITWSEPQKLVYQVRIDLNQKQQWGYDAYYDNTDLILDVNKRPKIGKDLNGLKIAIDAGHSPDSGAVGPTGLLEKEVNLHLAYRLKYLLEKHGAKVVMTRGGMEAVDLYERPKRAIENGCDILISIHNNALPDGVNPFVNNGVSTYYYHPESLVLAKSIQKELVKKLDIPDYGVYYASFALTRPTQLLSILVECAFIMYPEQEMMLREDKFKQKAVEGIYRGIKKFISDNE
jgi:N-acetylmuramoyl-L-alanine amidase